MVSSQHGVGRQVGAHGTGAAIPPVDETVVAMTLVTPGQARRPACSVCSTFILRMGSQCYLGVPYAVPCCSETVCERFQPIADDALPYHADDRATCMAVCKCKLCPLLQSRAQLPCCYG